MTIAQALKEKNKIVARMQKLWERFQRQNLIQKGITRSYSPRQILTEIRKLSEELTLLKTKLQQASNPIRYEIFRLAELKSMAEKIKYLETEAGPVYDRYSERLIEKEAEIELLEKDELIDSLEQEIENLQRYIDEFNFKTYI
jgi:hypothetical protein